MCIVLRKDDASRYTTVSKIRGILRHCWIGTNFIMRCLLKLQCFIHYEISWYDSPNGRVTHFNVGLLIYFKCGSLSYCRPWELTMVEERHTSHSITHHLMEFMATTPLFKVVPLFIAAPNDWSLCPATFASKPRVLRAFVMFLLVVLHPCHNRQSRSRRHNKLKMCLRHQRYGHL